MDSNRIPAETTPSASNCSVCGGPLGGCSCGVPDPEALVEQTREFTPVERSEFDRTILVDLPPPACEGQWHVDGRVNVAVVLGSRDVCVQFWDDAASWHVGLPAEQCRTIGLALLAAAAHSEQRATLPPSNMQTVA